MISEADLRRVYSSLNSLRNHSINEVEIYSGWIKNLHIKLSRSVLIINGSLCKYYFDGENQHTLNRRETRLAIEKMENELGISLIEASINRIDVGCNIIVDENANTYFKYLVETRFYTRLEQPSGLYFQTSNRSIVFYDKIAELKKKKQPIIPEFQDLNVFRFETRIIRNIKNYYDMDTIQVADLFEDEFYDNLISSWYKEYQSIRKANEIIEFNKDVLTSARKLKHQLAVKGLETIGGYAGGMKLVEQANREKLFSSSKQLYDVKETLRKLNTDSELTIASKHIEELDEKMEYIYLSNLAA